MPTTEYIQQRLIKLVKEAPGRQITRRDLLKCWDKRHQERADYYISLLISLGVFVTTGLGVKNSPRSIGLNINDNPHRCPLCRQPVSSDPIQ